MDTVEGGMGFVMILSFFFGFGASFSVDVMICFSIMLNGLYCLV